MKESKDVRIKCKYCYWYCSDKLCLVHNSIMKETDKCKEFKLVF